MERRGKEPLDGMGGNFTVWPGELRAQSHVWRNFLYTYGSSFDNGTV